MLTLPVPSQLGPVHREGVCVGGCVWGRGVYSMCEGNTSEYIGWYISIFDDEQHEPCQGIAPT